MTLSIQTSGLPLDDPTRTLVETKLADALRPLRGTDPAPLGVTVTLTQTAGAAGDVHASARVTGAGTTFHAEAAAPHLEPAVVEMKHDLSRQVRDWRATRRDAVRRSARRAAGRG